MVIITENSTYTLQDMGDGGFIMTSTNPKYAGPVMVRLQQPYVGFSAYMHFLEGPKKGRTLITSVVKSVS